DRDLGGPDHRLHAEGVQPRHPGGHGHLLRRRRLARGPAVPGAVEGADRHQGPRARLLRRPHPGRHRRPDRSRECWSL
ncbi:MAG: hypothetical protein AVDCRST_MAG41-2134, partial [uncultured Corynebacteriales bacterium]